MEDLWRIQNSGIELEDLADLAEYQRFLKRFRDNEEQGNRRELLYGEQNPLRPKTPTGQAKKT